MNDCTVCGQELEPGYSFCHFCGAPLHAGAPERQPDQPGSALVDLVDRFKGLVALFKELGASARKGFEYFLGSPVSIQRQVLYALVAGFTFAAPLPLSIGILRWLEAWLCASVLLLVPISYWLTGVIPLSGVVNAFLGPEYSLRRRIILSFLLMAAPLLARAVVALLLAGALSLTFGRSAPDRVQEDRPAEFDLAQGGEFPAQAGELPLLPLAGSFLVSFYLMGFVATWRAVPGCDASVTREGLGSKAASVANQIREGVENWNIPSLEKTRVTMAKLRRYTAGASSGTEGEQLIFIRGTARIVVFVQNFGDGLLVRWVGFYDASGRRLWLFVGYFVGFFDRLVRRWMGSSPVLETRQFTQTLSPASRSQVLLRAAGGGIFARALRLVHGVSEYAWNELYALEGAVRESVVAALKTAVASHEEAERIRSQIERHRRSEALAGWAGAGASA